MVLIYRDFIYYNGDKIESILAQINSGLLENVIEDDQKEHQKGGKAKTSLLMELLGFPVSGEINYSYTSTSSLQNTKSLHDYAFEEMRQGLKEKKLLYDVTNLSHSDFKTTTRTFVKISGKLNIFDYESLSKNLSNIGVLDKLFNGGEKDNSFNQNDNPLEDMMKMFVKDEQPDDEFEQFSKLVSTLYADLTTIEITNNTGLSFSGTINKEYLRETIRNIIYKYGSNLEGKWEMVCQITKIPKKESTNINEKINLFGKNIKEPDLDSETTLADYMNNIVTEFNQIQEAFASVNHPKIAIEPIAIYKKHI